MYNSLLKPANHFVINLVWLLNDFFQNLNRTIQIIARAFPFFMGAVKMNYHLTNYPPGGNFWRTEE
ncbi:hypothetical protein EDS67_23355 [candidate division KSB1 bacterium]|nr:MAG: hypothetical protein EDS67_23355 [candidate division KSB1 bacterium]MBC6952168.1 hypothetical protein [candidate division KSB1 bacterium]MCE7942686.1 hypothetical protein [Chlorobi bacterium CHB1]